LGEQVHLSLTGDPTEMVVMWVSAEYYENASVRYYQPGFNSNNKMLASAVQSTYTDGGWVGNIYTAVMTSLVPSTEYYYELSEGEIYSRAYQFYSAPALNTPKSKPKYVRRDLNLIADYEKFNAPIFEFQKHNTDDEVVASPVIALYGDMDTLNNSNETAISLATLASNYSINLVIHNGDISYADQDEQIWDTFFRMVQGYTSRVPFMTSPGNHETYYNFSAYYARLTNPISQSNSPSKQYYSFNYQNIHFVSWSFEEYKGLDLLPGEPQYDWLVNDLAEANNNRDLQPWIVLFGHRPLYCSTTGSNCKQAYYMRFLLEDIINQYHVDVVIQAHDHNYERSYPVYKNQTLTTSYDNPPAPVYFVVGTGGVCVFLFLSSFLHTSLASTPL
jgi:acid phosphatase type 7